MNRTESVDIQCPYCGESLSVVVDCSVENQRYIEDCQVCCRPINLVVAIDEEGTPTVEAWREDDV